MIHSLTNIGQLMLFMQIMSTSSTYKALHTPWCHSILVGRVSLAEYLLVLRVLFPLLQMVQFIMAIARTASVRRG